MTSVINASTTTGISLSSDTTGNLAIQTSGTTVATAANGALTVNSYSAGASLITSGTAQNTTSGTSITFIGIPSWVKRITVMFQQVSTNGSSVVLVQVGSGSPQTSGYLGAGVSAGGTNVVVGANYTTGFGLGGNNSASVFISGSVVLTQIYTNVWNCSYSLARSDAGYSATGGGSTGAMSGALDRVRITTVNGTDTFSAGAINILYE